ncbi:hypothetical protein TWF481_001730 [Arthrobotrys musiformis]|uniref:P-type Cu(+) transporter n=1 Tax=Arthrobotrys musiformis TaxID=47236 RepID=A0AAV9VVE4_9PEZI
MADFQLRTMAPQPSSSGNGADTSNYATTTVAVEGMTCGSCSASIESEFKGVDGVKSCSVSLILNRAVVIHDSALLNAEKVVDMIEDKGFDATLVSTVEPRRRQTEPEDARKLTTTTVSVDGMTCGACTSAVEKGFADMDGIVSVDVSLMMNRAVVVHEGAKVSAQTIVDTIEDRGFDAALISSVESKQKQTTASHYATSTIGIEGMTCGACTSAVEGGLKDVAGIGSVSVSLVMNRAVIQHDPEVISAEQIAEIIEDRGFDARVISTDLPSANAQRDTKTQILNIKIYGMQDEGSVTAIERLLLKLDGIESALVTFKTMRGEIEYYPSVLGVRTIFEAIEAAGFNALMTDNEESNAQLESLAKTKEIREWKTAFLFSLTFALPVFLISMIIPMFIKPLNFGNVKVLIPGLFLGDLVCLLLTLPVQFGIGKRFYRSAWKSLKHKSATMDVLVILGTTAAFVFSCVSMLISIMCPPHTRPATVFDTCTMLITFISLGRWLENRAKGSTSTALSKLMSLAPPMATIYVNPSIHKSQDLLGESKSAEQFDIEAVEERKVPTELLQVGDIVILRPGDKIPADGVVTYGESFVDESMVTGEAMPIQKSPGSHLVGGTVNGTGRLDFRVTRAGRDTQLSQIVKLVQEAQTSRAPIQRMADVVAGYFVPGVVSLGLITFVVWMILSHVLTNPPAIFMSAKSGGSFMVCLKLCISVVVFACPCALGLATPTAVMVGTGVGAQNGILVKGGEALETATKVTKVVFDKTGTLTVGKMTVARFHQSSVWNSSDWRITRWWSLVGLAETGSEHPIGRSIANFAKSQLGMNSESNIEGSISDFSAVVGRGITAGIVPAKDSKKHTVHIGNAAFLRENDITLAQHEETEAMGDAGGRPDSSKGKSEKSSGAGQTVVFVAIDGNYAGYLCLSDEIKADAKYAIMALRRMGIKVAMVTGDQRPTALAVADAVGIDKSQVWAGVSPDEKQDLVSIMKEEGDVVAMVGDGINDSPALATANVGIAMASGTDVAIEAADIVLMRSGELLDIPASLHLAKTIFRRIRLNLLWACGYNVVGMPFAMGVFLPFGLHLHPMAAGAAMAASSVSVVCSSLLLKYWKRPAWMTIQGIEEEIGTVRGEKWWMVWKRFGRKGRDSVAYQRVETAEV